MLAFKALESVRARGEVEQEHLKARGRREGGERGQHLGEDQAPDGRSLLVAGPEQTTTNQLVMVTNWAGRL